MSTPSAAPVLSTPVEATGESVAVAQVSESSLLSEEELDLQYEIKRTVDEIRARKWQRVALQFPDSMLVDAPRVFDRLNAVLSSRYRTSTQHRSTNEIKQSAQGLTTGEGQDATIEESHIESLSILGDTSYGACCVDEIAAEHASADGVVHYGRSCLSPTQRLPVIYVFTSKPLDHDSLLRSLTSIFPDTATNLYLLADVPWQHHLSTLMNLLKHKGYTHILAPDLIHDPTSPLPNRAVDAAVRSNPDRLKDYSVFHISTPPTALILSLASRVRQLYIYDTEATLAQATLEASSPAMLRRRYASLLRLSSASVIGILINTLSVKNYMAALEHVQTLIEAAGKKSYTFVVGKLNPAKLANFAEVGGWVVIGCWESSLIDSKEFLAPVITPFELEVALMKDDSRVWGQEWTSDFQTLLQRTKITTSNCAEETAVEEELLESSDDEPPEFDLRTGRYVSRPQIGRTRKATRRGEDEAKRATAAGAPSSTLVQRAKGDVATINGVASPGAEFLREKRDWQGLGSDFDIEYDRDAQGNIQGAAMEEGRSGIARGYAHSLAEART